MKSLCYFKFSLRLHRQLIKLCRPDFSPKVEWLCLALLTFGLFSEQDDNILHDDKTDFEAQVWWAVDCLPTVLNLWCLAAAMT